MTDKEMTTPLVLEINAGTAMVLIAQIQLATRHPANTGASRQIAEGFARRLQAVISDRFPEMAVILEMGWDPDYDMP